MRRSSVPGSMSAAACILIATAILGSGPAGAQEGRPPAASASPKAPEALTAADLRREIDAILASAETKGPLIEASDSRSGPEKPSARQVRPPRGAAPHPAARPTDLVLVRGLHPRLRRDARKAVASSSKAPLPAPKDWRSLGYAGARAYEPRKGVDRDLLEPGEAARARGFSYAFLILNEYLSAESEKQLAGYGVRAIGRHAGALKAAVPLDPEALKRVAELPFVEWVGYARSEQKIDPNLAEAARRLSNLPAMPVTVSAFDTAGMTEVRSLLARRDVRLGRADARLNSFSAVVPVRELERLARHDAVLYLELNRPGGGGHDNSMAVMGVDYIRPGGFGTRFSASPIRLGILDTGFMVGSAAATMHQDLNKFGCGRNFTSDVAGVWNDQNGHGSHVLGTITGTGTAQARFRGVATGLGSSAATRIRAAKIWDSTSNGTQQQDLDGEDYMETGTACGSDRPMVVNMSGGASGANQTGTDARSRNVDQIIWDHRQSWILCSGNSGPGAGVIWSPGVAKNVLTVGNVLDSGDGTIGDIRNSSSRGPTGDGRMKPNVVATGTTNTSVDAGTTNGYDDKVGCSMATPHVTGVAATVMEHYPEFQNLPHLMRAHLMATSLLHDNGAAPADNSAAPDNTRNTFGLGRVNPYVAHWAHFNAAGWSTHWAWRTITDSRWGFRDIDVPAGASRLVVVLTWDEQAASAGASAAVDYDLDLWIDRAPFCTPDSMGQCGEWASQSWIDNVEYLIIESPPAGSYRLKIINWDAPSRGVPAAIAATIVRGDTTPAMSLQVSANTGSPTVGRSATITTTVSNPAWIASGVHLAATGIPAGVTVEQVQTVREDNMTVDFTAALAMSLGNIVQGDSRSATWRFRFDTPGAKRFDFRASSENGGTQDQSITLVATP